MTLEELYESTEEWVEYAYIFSQQGKWFFFRPGQAALVYMICRSIWRTI